MRKARNLSTWERNYWVTGTDKQSQHRDQVHLTLYTVLSRQWPCLSHRAVWMCAGVSQCVRARLIEPLRCSPLGLPDIISHYPRHSSNTAGARERGCLVPPSCLPAFFCCSFTRFPRGGLSKRNSRGASGDANLCILEEHADVGSRERKKGKGINKEERTAGNISIPPIVLCSLPLPWSKKKSTLEQN